MALEESVLRSSFIILPRSSFQDQAPTALWINNHPPIQDQAPTALEESVLSSSFIVLPRSSPNDPLHQQSSTNSRSSPDGPRRKCSSFFVHRSSKIKPQRPFTPTIIHQFKIKPRWPLDQQATVFQDQAQKPLKIRSSLFFKIKPKSP
ncbi:hypothetical protein ACFX2I_022980 [Malus domestica]